MSTYRSGAGDPARTMALLWRQAGNTVGRGPKPALSVDALVRAAIALADSEGLDALTMRSLAARLSVAPMALYTYVPGKAELVDVMLDALYAEMPRELPRDVSWRARLESIANDNYSLYTRHPWLSQVDTTRPPLGPGMMTKYEYELSALEGTGLSDLEMDASLTAVLGLVVSCARMAAGEHAAQRESQQSDGEWWSANAPLLARVFDYGRFPVAARVGQAAGEAHGGAYSAEHAYSFGLGLLLDGLERRISAQRK